MSNLIKKSWTDYTGLDNSPPRIFQPKNSEWPKKKQEKEPNSAPAWQTTFAPAYAGNMGC